MHDQAVPDEHRHMLRPARGASGEHQVARLERVGRHPVPVLDLRVCRAGDFDASHSVRALHQGGAVAAVAGDVTVRVDAGAAQLVGDTELAPGGPSPRMRGADSLDFLLQGQRDHRRGCGEHWVVNGQLTELERHVIPHQQR